MNTTIENLEIAYKQAALEVYFFSNCHVAETPEQLSSDILSDLEANDPATSETMETMYTEMSDLAKYFFELAAIHPEKANKIAVIAPYGCPHALYVSPSDHGTMRYLIGYCCA